MERKLRERGIAQLLVLGLSLFMAACGSDQTGTVETSSAAVQAAQLQTPGDPASIALVGSDATVTLTSDTAWNLSKTGSVSGNTVTWTITATEIATVPGQLVVQGQMTVTNSGSGAATIGNILVNLQTRQGNKWNTVSSDVADATNGDAATTAHIHAAASSENQSTFSENGASGHLEFMDATDNTVFSLVPEKLIGPGETVSLLFQATFDNNTLHLSTGTSIRTETIVSFGNATIHGNSTANVDINGNGTIDDDEDHIRSVPARITMSVPGQTNATLHPTLSDTIGDISTTGTASVSNVTFNLGATSGTVTATVDGGTDGGKVTNCAHLTDPGMTVTSGAFTFTQVGSLDLQACDTEDVDSTQTGCTAGAPGCGWSTGDERSFGQFQWDASAGGAPVLTTNYSSVYASSGGLLTVGIVGASTYSMTFTGSSFVLAYLPATGPDGTLSSDLIDPTSSAAGQFGGDTVALKLNIDYSAAGALPHAAPTPFGNLLLCNVTPAGLDGSTVGDLLAAANTLLSGTGSAYSVAEIAPLVRNVNDAFVGGTPSAFAQAHLFTGNCP